MKLHAITIEGVRSWIGTSVIDELQPGLNLFTGANGTGKTTLVDAIRAAFLERYTTTAVSHLRPRHDSGASPTIGLSFEFDGIPYRLQKTFLTKRRCNLQAGTEVLEGEDAENRLSKLFGFDYAGKGASKAEHWGIPGLLWVQQGTGQNIMDALENADDRLQAALRAMVGAVTSSEGDAIIQQLQADRAELVTEGRNTPRGHYDATIKELARTDEELANYSQTLKAYEKDVDELGQADQELSHINATRPWGELENKARDAAQSLEKARHQSGELASLRTQADTQQRLQATFRSRIQDLGGLRAELAAAGDRKTRSSESHDAAKTGLQRAENRFADAVTAAQAAADTLAMVNAERQRTEINRGVANLEGDLDKATQAVHEARRLAEVSAEKARVRASKRMDQATITRLRELDRNAREASLKLAAVGTRIEYVLEEGVTIDAGTEQWTGTGEQLLARLTVLKIPGLGQLSVSPGGEDLDVLAQEIEAARDALKAALRDSGVASLDAAEMELLDAQGAETARIAADAALKAAAPKGVEVLVSTAATIEGRLQTERGRLDTLPPPADSELPDFDDARAAAERRASERDAASDDKARAGRDLAQAEMAAKAVAQEYERLKNRVESPSFDQELAQYEEDLVKSQRDAADLAEKIQATEEAIRGLQPELLEQDVKRYRDSADLARKNQETLIRRVATLRGQVEAAGAQGLAEKVAGLEITRQRLQERVEEFKHRVVVVDNLLGRLNGKRKAIQQKLLAPLQARVDHYTRVHQEGGHLVIDEALRPSTIRTPQGLSDGQLVEQSFGMREQLGLISRLAYADVLKEAGVPTLVILDDALVHVDANNLVGMKRVLYDAATRHQILMFTCHPDKWQDVGAPTRDVEQIRKSG